MWLHRLASTAANYWLGFVSTLCAALILIMYGARAFAGSWPDAIACALIGFFGFGLVEYGMHRWVFHNPRTSAYEKHMEHHDGPQRLLGMPFFFAALVGLAIWWLLLQVLPATEASFLPGFMLLGYAYYGIVHHIQHHLSLQHRVLMRSWAHHTIHHKVPNRNFGVTSSLWDRVFGTQHKKH